MWNQYFKKIKKNLTQLPKHDVKRRRKHDVKLKHWKCTIIIEIQIPVDQNILGNIS